MASLPSSCVLDITEQANGFLKWGAGVWARESFSDPLLDYRWAQEEGKVELHIEAIPLSVASLVGVIIQATSWCLVASLQHTQ